MKSLLSEVRVQQGWVVGEAIWVRAGVDPLQSFAVEAHHLAGVIACVPVCISVILAMHVESQDTLEV